MKRYNYYFDIAIMERVRVAAFHLRISMAEFIRRAINAALKKGEK